MPYSVTHVILTIILVDLYRDYFTKHKNYFTLHTIMIAGIAGLLPDIDIIINKLLSILGYSFEIMQHGGLTHTALFGLIFLIPGYYFFKRGGIKNKRIATYFFVIVFGILFHNFLDFFLWGGAQEGVMWLWPLSSQPYKIHLLEEWTTALLGIDAAILILWLWHEEAKHKIRDFF